MAGQGALAGLLAGLLALPAACDLPRDPRATRDRVRGGTLAAAVVAPRLTEAEERALALLAEGLGARLEAAPDGIHEAVEALGRGGVQVVIGAVPKNTPLSAEAAASRPMGPEEFVMLLPPGENAFLVAANRAVSDAEEAGR